MLTTITKTTSTTTITFNSIREFAVHEAIECINLGIPYWMYVSYMQQWDKDGSKGYIFDSGSYDAITIELAQGIQPK